MRVQYMSVWLILVFVLAATAPAAAQMTPQERVRVLTELYDATLMAPTALEGRQIASLGIGNALPLDQLEDSARQQVLNAAQMVVPQATYEKRLRDVPAGTRLALKVAVKYGLEFSGSAFGERKIAIDLEDHVPEIRARNRTDSGWSDTTPDVDDPPTYSDILSQAPDDPEARVTYLRQSARSVLGPMGETRLSVLKSIPFAYTDFASPKTQRIGALEPQLADWVRSVYDAHTAKRQQEREIIAAYLESQTGSVNVDVVCKRIGGKTVCADMSVMSEPPLPSWSEIQNATVTPKVSFRILIKPLSDNETCDIGYGWAFE